MGPRNSALSLSVTHVGVRSCRRPARGGSPAGLPPGRKSFGRQEAGELGHWAAVSKEPGREGQARARGPAGGWGCAFPPSTAGRAAPRHSPPHSSPGPQHYLRRILCPSAHVAEAWVSPEGEARDSWMRLAGALGEGATPAAEITIGSERRTRISPLAPA